MNASISVVCYKSKTLANGENPLMLQISKDGRRKYQSLGVSIDPKYWDFQKGKPNPNCPDGELIQKILLDKVTEVQKQILILAADQKEITPTKLLEKRKTNTLDKTVGEFYTLLMSQYLLSDKVGNRRVYKMSYNSLKEFSKGRLNLLFADIDLAWLNRYEKWLRSKGNMETTISLLFRTLRSAYNKAIDERSARKTSYPFNDFKVSKFDVKTKKRAITKEGMLKIMGLDLTNESESVRLSRDIFIFSYLCGGINFTDVANLRSESIIDGRLEYVRQKTGKKLSFYLSEEASKIIARYSHLNFKHGYLFPILDAKVHQTALQKQNRIHKLLVRTNSDLKTIAGLAEVNAAVSTYYSRYSFATVLKNAGVSVALISEALSHADIATTTIYLDSFDNKQLDEAMGNLL
jgi:site-specific recombinase XerD